MTDTSFAEISTIEQASTQTPENFGRVPRTYITTKLDRVVSPSLQQRMYGATPCNRVLEIDTGHCPFAAAPERFVELLK